MKNKARERPTTFGIPQPVVEHYWDWEGAIVEAVGPPPDCWMAYKFIDKLKEHKRKYPAFMPERVAVMFINAPKKTRAFYCYQPIKAFTKSIHKAASFRSLCNSQS